MSLVDASYDSDDDDVVEVQEEEEKEREEEKKGVELTAATMPAAAVRSAVAPNATVTPSAVISSSASSMIERQSAQGVTPTDSAPLISLPDVSELFGPSPLDPPTTSETLKKRSAANGLASSLPRSKVPRGNLQPSRVAPDTAGGKLTPPQLRGRSNVATEDLDKIFSRKQKR
ncbi:unnamed protein product [Calypogeia fissa]